MPSAKVAPTVETDEKGEKSQLSPSASLLIAKTDEKASTATSHDSKGGAGPGFPKAKVISVNAAVAVSFGGRTFTKVAGSGVVVGAMASPPKDKKDGGGGTPGRKKQQLTVKVGDILTIAMFTSDLSELYRATNELGAFFSPRVCMTEYSTLIYSHLIIYSQRRTRHTATRS